MSYHHFGSIEDITKMLAFFLRPGGTLLVVDILRTKPTSEPGIENHPEVAHTHGFTEEQIKKVFNEAGLKTVTFKPFKTKIVIGDRNDVTLFIASAVNLKD